MEENMPASHSYYNFEIRQLASGPKGAFCIIYGNDQEIAVYDGIVPLEKIRKSQITYKLDYFHPMDFLHFSIDFFNFRTRMSVLFYKYKFETKQEFFFDYSFFSEYCSQIIELIYQGINDLDQKLMISSDKITQSIQSENSFEAAHQKAISLIEKFYNSQRSFSSNPILNYKIHLVVAYFPEFGLNYDTMRNELKLFDEKSEYLSINKKQATKKDWAEWFGEMKRSVWKPVEELFHETDMQQSCKNAELDYPKKKKIETKLKDFSQKFTQK